MVEENTDSNQISSIYSITQNQHNQTFSGSKTNSSVTATVLFATKYKYTLLCGIIYLRAVKKSGHIKRIQGTNV